VLSRTRHEAVLEHYDKHHRYQTLWLVEDQDIEIVGGKAIDKPKQQHSDTKLALNFRGRELYTLKIVQRNVTNPAFQRIVYICFRLGHRKNPCSGNWRTIISVDHEATKSDRDNGIGAKD